MKGVPAEAKGNVHNAFFTCCWSVAQSCQTLCDPCSTSGFPVLHHLAELAQTHVHCAGDAMQASSVIPFSSHLQSLPALVQFSSVAQSCLTLCRPPCPSYTPGVHPNPRPSSQWCHPTISSSVVPFSSCPNASQHQSLFQWVNSLHEVAKVLEFQL